MMNSSTIDSYEILSNAKKLYFVGIGGVSMFGLSIFAKNFGYDIAGSDLHLNERCKILQNKNINITTYQDGSHLLSFNPDCVIYSAACPPDNLDLKNAKLNNIPCFERGVFLGYLTTHFRYVFNIAGTHGKTTTTAMCDSICQAAKIDRYTHAGASVPHFNNGTVNLGIYKNLLINEACEYSNSFLNFKSNKSLILNIDLDHIDYFKNIQNLIKTFVEFSLKIEKYGYLIVPFKDKYKNEFLIEYNKQLSSKREKEAGYIVNIKTFALENEINEDEEDLVDFLAYNIKLDKNKSSFDVVHNGVNLGRIEIPVSGIHNVKNALAAVSTLIVDGYATFTACQLGLKNFSPAEGRFTYKGNYKGAEIFTDYAHHPTSTLMTINSSLLSKPKNLWVVYQPLTYDRVKRLFNDYLSALKSASFVFLYEIFSDREQDTQNISSSMLADELIKQGTPAKFYKNKLDIFKDLENKIGENDIVLFLGPEEVRSFADIWLKNKEKSQ